MWESNRLLQILLPLMGDPEGRFLSDSTFEDFFNLANIADAKGFFSQDELSFRDEDQQILTELADATLIAGFLNAYTDNESVTATRRHFFEKARSIAAVIASEHPKLLKSRPYSNWLYLAETEPIGLHEMLGSPNSQVIPPLVWCRDFMGGIQLSLPSGVNPASRTHRPVSAAAATCSQESSLKILMTVAKQQGDYKWQLFLLQVLLNNCSHSDGRLALIRDMTNLRQGVMGDSGGYLQSLIAEWFVLTQSDLEATSATPMNLYSRFVEFNDSFPSHFDFRPEERQRLGVVLFDVPVFDWLKHQAMEQLLRGMNRHAEADVSRIRIPQIERHLPYHATVRLGIAIIRCVGCADCSGDTYPYYPHNLPMYGGGPYIPYPHHTYPTTYPVHPTIANQEVPYWPISHQHAAHRASRYTTQQPAPSKSASSRSVSPLRDSPPRVSQPSSPPSGLRTLGQVRHRDPTVEEDTAWHVEDLIPDSRTPGPQVRKRSSKSQEGPKGVTIRVDSTVEKGLDGRKTSGGNQDEDQRDSDGGYGDDEQ